MKLNIQLFAEGQGELVITTRVDTKGIDKGIKEIEQKDVDISIQPKLDVDNTGETIEKLFAKEKKPKVEIDLDISNKSTEELIQMEREFTKEYEHYAGLVEPFEKQQDEIIAKRAQAIQVDSRVHKIRINMTNEEIEQYHQLEKASEEYANKMNEAIEKSIEVNKVLADRGVILHKNIEAEKTGKEWYNPRAIINGKEYWDKSYLDLEEDRAKPELEETEFEVQALTKDLERLYDEYNKIQKKKIIDEQEAQKSEKLREEISYLVDEIKNLSGVKLQVKGITDIKEDLPDIKEKINNIGERIKDVIKKTGKWALAIFGIRTAYNSIRSAMATLTQYDPQLKANVDYIRFVLANTVKPIIEWIIKAVQKILGFIGGAIEFFTGYNIFKNSGIDDYKKALEGSNKSAKELRKTLAGFDEMNIINKDGSVGSGGLIGKLPEDIYDFEKNNANFAQRFKKWFYGGDYDNLGDALVGNVKKLPQLTWDLFFKGSEPLRTFLDKNWITPVKEKTKEIIEDTKPIWQPMAKALKKEWQDNIKPQFEKMKNVLKDMFKPSLEAFKEWKRNMLELFTPFLNTIIDGINATFGIFGVHIDHIDEQSYEATEDIKKYIDELDDKDISPKELMFKFAADTSGAEKGFKVIADNIQKTFDGISFEKMKDKLAKAFAKLPGFTEAGARKAFGLAKGGIINLPGRGVPLTVGGEQRPEGVVPLTDTQQMALLGEAIGKFVRIDNVIDVNMDSRKIKRIMATSDSRDRMAGNGYVR